MTSKKYNAQFQIKELQGLFSFNSPASTKVSICTDSRVISSDQLFLPLIGENFDGHDFINNVLDKGIKLSFCSASKLTRVKEEHKKKLIIVRDILDAYHLLANYYRKKINPKVVAVTGSSGKTTTKELIAEVLATKFKTHKTEANFNNEIGIPKTILEMPEDTKALVLELAMRQKGEIKYLSKTSEPDIGVITNIGTAHIGRLGSIDKIIRTKCELLEHLKKGGLAVLHNDSKLLQYASELWNGRTATVDLSYVNGISFKEGKSHFRLAVDGILNEKYSINALGEIHVENSLFAILIAKYFGLEKDKIQSALSNFNLPVGRGNLITVSKDVYIINEAYNANPESVKAAVTNLAECWGDGFKKIVVLGELAELGKHEEDLLKDLASFLKNKRVLDIITVGSKLKQITFASNVRNNNKCCDILKKLMEPKTVILIKGSHVAKLEEVVDYFNRPKGKWKNRKDG